MTAFTNAALPFTEQVNRPRNQLICFSPLTTFVDGATNFAPQMESQVPFGIVPWINEQRFVIFYEIDEIFFLLGRKF